MRLPRTDPPRRPKPFPILWGFNCTKEARSARAHPGSITYQSATEESCHSNPRTRPLPSAVRCHSFLANNARQWVDTLMATLKLHVTRLIVRRRNRYNHAKLPFSVSNNLRSRFPDLSLSPMVSRVFPKASESLFESYPPVLRTQLPAFGIPTILGRERCCTRRAHPLIIATSSVLSDVRFAAPLRLIGFTT